MPLNLSPELLQQIQAAIADGSLSVPTRSPIRPRQLHDLRLLPTKDDPRPTFFWSAEAPRDGVDLTKTTEFPKLMWSPEGQEITVPNADEQARYLQQGYALVAPADVVIDPMAAIQQQWASLSPEDQALILESQKQDRIKALKDKLAALPAERLEALLAQATPTAKRPKKEAMAS